MTDLIITFRPSGTWKISKCSVDSMIIRDLAFWLHGVTEMFLTDFTEKITSQKSRSYRQEIADEYVSEYDRIGKKSVIYARNYDQISKKSVT